MKKPERSSALKRPRVKKMQLTPTEGTNDNPTPGLHSKTLNWSYVPTIIPNHELRQFIEEYLDARKKLAARLAGQQFQALKDYFRDLLDSAGSDGMHIIYRAIQTVIDRDLDSIVNATNPLAWPLTIELMTQPSTEGYDITAIFFRHKDGGLEIVSLGASQTELQRSGLEVRRSRT